MNTFDLSATVLFLTPTRPGNIPAAQGRAAHAFFLHQIANADPVLAARLHETEQVKPFTCSNLWKGENKPAEGETNASRLSPHVSRFTPPSSRLTLVSCTPGETWFLRYTTLSTDLTTLWLEHVLPHLPDEIILGDLPFRIEDVLVTAEAHPWAGHTTYAELGAPYLLAQSPAFTRWTLAFASPTAFRSGGMTIPVPLPDLVFGSLLDRWNAWAPVALSPETRRFAQECVAISNYRLRTRAIPGKEDVVQRGAVGRCDYAALNRDRYWCSMLSTLAAYAFYSGVGYQTTQGMGMCRWVVG